MRELDPTGLELDGQRLIEASAGTGKTYTIALLYLRLVLEKGLSPEQILVVTYTRAATAELRGRIRSRLEQALRCLSEPEQDIDLDIVLSRQPAPVAQARLTRALFDFDRAAITTIHGFAGRALRDHAFESGQSFELEVVSDTSRIIQDVVADFWTRHFYRMRPDLVELVVDGLKIEELIKQAHIAERHHDSVWSPPPPRSITLETAFSTWCEARSTALDVFDQREVLERLASADLNRNSYRPRSVASWIERLAEGGGRADRALASMLGRLSSGEFVLKKKGRPPQHPFFDAAVAWRRTTEDLLDAMSQHRDQLRFELANEVREEVTKRLRAQGKASFDELLRALRVALSKPEAAVLQKGLGARYRAALIDEFQDTDPQQYEIFRRLFSDSTLVLIGDPKQAIYGFRGADLFAYLRAAREVGEARYGLPVNYRSDPGVLRAVETLFGREPKPFVFEDLEFPSVRPRPGATDAVKRDPLGDAAMTFVVEKESGSTDRSWSVSTSVRLIAAILASEMTVSGREVEPGDFAVLTRTNRMSLELQSALRQRGIPAVFRGDRSVFETPVAEDLQVVLAALLQPHEQRTLRAALLTRLLGYSADPLLAEPESELAEHASRFLRLRDRWRTGGIALALEGLCAMYRIEQRMLVRSHGQRTLTDFLHLRELLHRAQHRHRFGPERLADWLRRRRSEPSRPDEDDENSVQMRLDTDEAAVQLFTIHTAKGLEFPLVVCPELGSVAHEPRGGPIAFHREDAMVLDLAAQPAASHLEAAQLEWRAEARRLLYVALTRAKHRIYIPWSRGRALSESALGSLVHTIDPESPSDIVRDLESLRSVSGGSIDYRDVESIPDVPFRGRVSSRSRRRARRAPRAVLPQRRTSSYSGWVQGVENVDEERDFDRDISASQVWLSRFKAGPTTGLLVHAVLEAAMSADSSSLAEFTRSALKRYGHDESKLPDLLAVVEAVRELKLDLGDHTSRFGEPSAGVAEFEFALRVAGRPGWQTRVEAAMRRTGGIYSVYADRFASLSASVLPGMLRGYIDWVGDLAGHSLVVDYKTNALPAYDFESLARVMVEHDYLLQALLYSVALRRYLRVRQRDTVFGGAHYVFVRGLRPDHGVFSIHPPESLLTALEHELVGDNE